MSTSSTTTLPTVFVVDDDDSAETFASAREFLAHERPSGPGCLVLDLRMPGMSGLDLQQQMIDRHQELPIVIVTGHGSAEMCSRALALGAVAVLLKPFRDDELLDAIDEALRRDPRSAS